MFRRTLIPLFVLCLGMLSPVGNRAWAQSPTTPFVSAVVADTQAIVTASIGDLWPSCWADDDNLYAANGDGKGFDLKGTRSDVVVNRISGTIDSLSGVALAKGDQVGSIWGPEKQNYNRKPTGMVCVDGHLYLAVQDLNKTPANAYNDAPSASISRSTDHGVTWTWDSKTPMFSNHQFTTIFFLDFGKNNANAIDKYVYVYGLDNNWHEAHGLVPDPVDVYLARVTPDALQIRSAWQFYAGMDASGNPTWTPDIASRVAVLHDDRRNSHGSSVISQGGVVYNKPLNVYIYSSWTGSTFEFYAAPAPWGPWKLFLTKEFATPFTPDQYGGYATTIPSKFISIDGKTMWIQSNVCIPCGGKAGNYAFALRKFVVTTN